MPRPIIDGMVRYLGRRLVQAALVVLVAALGAFALLRIAPGDPLRAEADRPGHDAAALARLRARHGLDLPPLQHAARWFGAAVRGDLGMSISEQRPVRAVIADSLPRTIALSGAALLLASLVGFGAGTLQGWRPRNRVGRAAEVVLTAAYAVPEVALAIALLALLAVRWRMFPPGGLADPLLSITGTGSERLLDRLHHLALPAGTLMLAWSAVLMRQQRVALGEVAGEPFVRTARAKGQRESLVLRHHALRAALPSSLALLGAMTPVLVGGTVIVEGLFNWPGMGALLVTSVSVRDYPVVAGIVVVTATCTALASLATDVLIAYADPRLRAGLTDAT